MVFVGLNVRNGNDDDVLHEGLKVLLLVLMVLVVLVAEEEELFVEQEGVSMEKSMGGARR